MSRASTSRARTRSSFATSTGSGNAAGGGRPNPSFNQINAYTNEGRSDYKAFIASVNGTMKGGHILTASITLARARRTSTTTSARR